MSGGGGACSDADAGTSKGAAAGFCWSIQYVYRLKGMGVVADLLEHAENLNAAPTAVLGTSASGHGRCKLKSKTSSCESNAYILPSTAFIFDLHTEKIK